MLKRFGIIILCTFILLIPPYGRTLVESKSALVNAREARDLRYFPRAIEEFASSVSWDSPFNSASKEALEESLALLESDELGNELKLDFAQQLKSAVYGNRNFLRPEYSSSRTAVLKGLDLKISQLRAGTSELKPIVQYDLTYEPRFHFQLIGQVLFWGWIGFAVWTIWSGITPQGSIIRAQFIPRVSAAGLCYIMWLFVLRLT